MNGKAISRKRSAQVVSFVGGVFMILEPITSGNCI